MKISAPRLPPKLDTVSIELVKDELSFEAAEIKDTDMSGLILSGLDINEARLEKNSLIRAQLERLNARDLESKNTDFSGANLSNGSVNRAIFNMCRMTGVDFSTTSLHDVTFRDCKLDMSNFRFANLRRVQFIDCTLKESDFLGASLHDVVIRNCLLEKAIFDQVTCKQLDLRGSQLESLSGWRYLKHATIDDLQLVTAAPYLAHELGIIVRSD